MTRHITAVEQLLTPPDAWIQGTMAARADRSPVAAHTSEATCFCLIGAVSYAVPAPARDSTKIAIRAAIKELFPDRWGDGFNIISFNDHHETTHDDVLAVIRRAKEIAAS